MTSIHNLPTTARTDRANSDFSTLIEEARVHRDIYVDPEVFKAEMQRIYMRTWVYVGHDSEITHPGEYKTTSIGIEPVILSRDANGTARVLINRCSHRGSAVCQLPKGKVNGFHCNYHGWTFGLDGALRGVPFPDGYAGLDKQTMGLSSAPRVESYRGFIFASFNPNVPVLVEHLRDVLSHIDRFVEQVDGYEIQVAPDANEAMFNANWKMQLENSVDGYHLSFTHQSIFTIMQQRTGKPARYLTAANESAATTEALSNGHAVMDLRSIAPEALRNRLDTMPGAPPSGTDLNTFFGIENAEDVYLATTGTGMNVTIFPNLQLGSTNICEVHPLAVNKTRVVLRPVLLAGAPNDINRMRLRYHEIGSGPAGFVQPDDLEMFERVQAGLSADSVDWVQLGRGQDRETVIADDRRIGHITDEVPQRGQYRWWQQLMAVGS